MKNKAYAIPLRLISLFLFCSWSVEAQNFDFSYNNNGSRVCLVESTVDMSTSSVTIHLLDAGSNSNDPVDIYRRPLNGAAWTLVAEQLPPSTRSWTDTEVSEGEIWEYQIRRSDTWFYDGQTYDAIGYTIGTLMADKSGYQGQMILLVTNNIVNLLPQKYNRLKKEITGEGWYVKEIIVPSATDWDSGQEVVVIKSQIQDIYNTAPEEDKPKALFILGHVPLPRSGSTDVTAPDGHDENKGARGADVYYADMDDVYTDEATYDPDTLVTDLAINLPNDYKWDQDFFPSDIELAFGRVDFADLIETSEDEVTLIERYLDRLSNYKNVAPGFDMGNKTGFNFGYDNSNDGSYRSLPNISGAANVIENTTNQIEPQWVKENGPFDIYMQNIVVPRFSEWSKYGMEATVFSSDQSYWGFGDVPQETFSTTYSRIRSLLSLDTKCLVTLWTTTGINIFHQACTGEPLGIAMREIMNHNQENNKLEKPPQGFDEPAWWNRTHFTFYGDPTLRLFQVSPPSELTFAEDGSGINLEWTASVDNEVMGYHVFESTSEFGKYERISNEPIFTNQYTITNYSPGNWYMVKSLKVETSGCGQFICPSMGISIEDSIMTNIEDQASSYAPEVSLFPNPTVKEASIQSNFEMECITIYSMQGKEIKSKCGIHSKQARIEVNELTAGTYIISLSSDKVTTQTILIKE